MNEKPMDRPILGVTDPRSVKPTKEERRRATARNADLARNARVANKPEPMPWTDPDTAHRGLGPGHGGKHVTHQDVPDRRRRRVEP